MAKSSSSFSPQIVALIFLGLALGIGYIFLKPYISILVFALLLTLCVEPLYGWLRERNWSHYTAFAVSLLTLIVVLLGPVAVVARLTMNALSTVLSAGSMNNFWNSLSLDQIVRFVDGLGLQSITGTISADQVQSYLSNGVTQLARSTLARTEDITGVFAGAVPAVFITLAVLAAVLGNREHIRSYLYTLSPLSNQHDRLFVQRLKAMTLAMVRGTLIIAVLQGLLSTLFYVIADVPFAGLLGVLTGFSSFIPLGTGMVMVPVALLLALEGSWTAAAIIGFGYLIVIANVDNVVRPRLVSKDAAMHPALTLIGLFAGIAHFGLLGAVYGPVIMVLVVTLLEVYFEQQRRSRLQV